MNAAPQRPARRRLAAELLLALASGALMVIADYPRPRPLVAWFAAVPVLAGALRAGPRRAFAMGAVFGFIITLLPAWSFLPGLPAAAVAGTLAARTLLFGAAVAATAAAARAVSAGLAGWVFASFVVLAEWAAEAGGMGLWLTWASTQASLGPVRATAAVGGSYLPSFLVALANGSLAALVVGTTREKLIAVTTASAALAASALAARAAAPVPERNLRVAAVVHEPSPEISRRWDQREARSEDAWTVSAAYEALTQRAAAAGARVVVWPEYAIFLRSEDLAEWRRRVSEVARQTRAIVVAGFIDVGAGTNGALLVAPAGEPHEYHKQALVPGTESSWLHPGVEPFATIEWEGVRAASRICYDAEFTAGWRAAARAGAQVVALPSLDWPGIAERHAMQAVFRAVENGMALVRATRRGWSMIVSPSGAVTASETSAGRAEVLLVGDVPLARPGTAYSRAGNWLPAAAAAGLVVLVAAGLRSRRR